MTKQQLFDTVATHLLTQGAQSKLKESMCAYRGLEGRSCAIGCLIPDEKYDPNMEGSTTTDSNWGQKILEAAGIRPGQYKLASRLQDIHDYGLVWEWADELRKLAREFNLKTTATYVLPNIV